MIGEASDGPPPGGGRVATGVPRLRWLVVMILAAAAFAVVASRPNPPVTHPPTGDVAKIQQAVEDQLDPASGRDPLRDLPADFTDGSENAPVHVRAPDGTMRAVHPGGGCSSPWGDTRWDYSVGCKAHDLGYDMLRYAARKGQPLDPALRERLDDRLSQDMHAQCRLNPRGSPAFCEVVASLYTVGLVVNSWHQRWGPPQNEPVGPWSVAMVVIMLLIAVRAPAVVRRGVRHGPRRLPARPHLDPTERAQAGYLSFLRIVSLAGIVLAESVLAFTMRGTAEAGWVWPLTWLLQLVPLFFLAGGHANLLAWRAARDAGAGYGTYLVGRIGWLIRPVLAFVIAWLVVPLSLELLEAPDDAITAFGRLIVQPLWLLGLYLLVVAAMPVMHALHRRLPVATPLALLAGVVALSVVGGAVAGHVGGVLVALLFGQLAFHYADGTFWRLPRWTLVAGAVAAFGGLVALTTFGAQPKLQLAEPTGYAAFAPSLAGVLLLGLVQTCLVALPREPGLRAVAASAPARVTAFVRAAPMTVYLVYLCAMLLIEGVVGVARGGRRHRRPRLAAAAAHAAGAGHGRAADAGRVPLVRAPRQARARTGAPRRGRGAAQDLGGHSGRRARRGLRRARRAGLRGHRPVRLDADLDAARPAHRPDGEPHPPAARLVPGALRAPADELAAGPVAGHRRRLRAADDHHDERARHRRARPDDGRRAGRRGRVRAASTRRLRHAARARYQRRSALRGTLQGV